MQKLHHYDWSLIVGLGCLALVHPLLSITGLMERLGRPIGPWLVTALVSAVWVATVVLGRVRAPLATLVLTGLAAGLAVLMVGALLAPASTGWPDRLMLNPIVIAAVLASNTLWGALAGLAAVALRWALGMDRSSQN
ncbi:MAG: hypothetical protein HGA45_05175 [Chloroflexales bacterium]|nr:hypothetical protein [Chloroflexales bacterium]